MGIQKEKKSSFLSVDEHRPYLKHFGMIDGILQGGVDVSHHGGAAYYDNMTMDGAKPGIMKHSPNGLESEVNTHRIRPMYCQNCCLNMYTFDSLLTNASLLSNLEGNTEGLEGKCHEAMVLPQAEKLQIIRSHE